MLLKELLSFHEAKSPISNAFSDRNSIAVVQP